jgi:uncharacterized protein YdcH (DUF465 family)
MGTTVTRGRAGQDARHRLELEHQQLKRRVAELDRRTYLTPAEQLLVVELKKRKLAAKDALRNLTLR